MPPWGWSLDDDSIWKINLYEMSFVNGSLRTVSGDVSDKEGDQYNTQTGIMPGIEGSAGTVHCRPADIQYVLRDVPRAGR